MLYKKFCKAIRLLIESQYPHIFWTPYIVPTLNLVFKNICSLKTIEGNEISYAKCNSITGIVGDVNLIKTFIINYCIRFLYFNEFVKLNMLASETPSVSTIIIVRWFKAINEDCRLCWSMIVGACTKML